MDVDALLCSISGDWLEDPISTPCGHLSSRANLARWMEQAKECPKCRTNLSAFDVLQAPKLFDIAHLVEHAKAQGVVPEKKGEQGKWKAEITRLSSANRFEATRVGKLVLRNTSQAHQFRTLLIPVIDRSGSMGGAPIQQAQQALRSMVQTTYTHKNLVTTIVAYSDQATWRKIDTTMLPQEHDAWIAALSQNMGGTCFENAFNEIAAVCLMHKDDPTITSLEIVFLTDGADSYCQTPDQRQQLVMRVKNNMRTAWPKPWTINSIGFGQYHDASFLELLRVTGTSEGAYRFANPDENVDSLIGKIQSVVRVVAAKTAIPMKLHETTTAVLEGEGTVYWMDLTKYALDQPYIITLDVSGAQVVIEAEVKDLDDDSAVWEEWYGLQIDRIARELKTLTERIAQEEATEKKANGSVYQTLQHRIHFEFLLRRARAISSRLIPTSEHAARLASLLEMVRVAQSGGVVDAKQLNDLGYEGKFKTTYANKCNPYSTSTAKYMPPSMVTASQWRNPHSGMWTTFDTTQYRKLLSAKSSQTALRVLATGPTTKTIEWLEQNRDEVASFRDAKGRSLLTIASSCNLGRVAEWLLEQDDCALRAVDSFGHNAMDLSIMNGTWFTYQRLFNKGLRPTCSVALLLRTCLSKGHDHAIKMQKWTTNAQSGNKYFRTAAMLFRDKLVTQVDKDLVDAVPYNYQDVAAWLTARSNTGMSLQKALQMGMADMVDEALLASATEEAAASGSSSSSSTNGTVYSLEECFGVFANPTPAHVQIVDKLAELRKIDVTETVRIQVAAMDGINVSKDKFEEEISWPLYAAAEKGRLDMVQVLLKHNKSNIDNVNRRHVCALWIAACNNHIDVVMELLSAGANPNIVNENGSSALIPCCRKGYTLIAQLLLDHGLSLDHYVHDRDHPILQCCRDGQDEVLDIILSRLDSVQLQKWFTLPNPIDGYPPLLAAAELGHVACVEVCLKFGAPLEWRTADDNAIVAGATALHIAAFNGRTNVVQVLHQAKCDMLAQTNVLRRNVMHLAVIKKCGELIQYLRSTLTSDELENLNVKDVDGRLPAYYAHVQGSEAIRDEFFTDRLGVALQEMVESDDATSKACAEVMLKYGRTPGCFDYNEITGKTIGTQEVPLLTKALLTGNTTLVQTLGLIGSDWYQRDVSGLTPHFWASVLGQEQLVRTIRADNDAEAATQQMVLRVSAALQQSPQAKLLLNVTRGAPRFNQFISGATEVSLSELKQMGDGFGLDVPSQALVSLKGLQNRDVSLMSWLEKLKNPSVFAPGKAVFEKLLWDAKVHVIGHLASAATRFDASDAPPGGVSSMGSLQRQALHPMQIFALYFYTAHSSIFESVNKALAQWQLPASTVWQPFVNCLFQAVSCLPEFDGECYRGVEQPYDPEIYGIGCKVEWKGFTMTSLQWENAAELIQQKKGMIFIIKSRLGRIIAPYAANPEYSQTVFAPGSSFEVTNHYVGNTIALQQRNIREKTYLMSNYDKVKQGKACIIVELREL